ncbi:MAG: CTP synthase [Candidatus Cloacimonadota bacterium]|nr:CTP synthase [Candidatus Cloacimonadota bacterium]
MAKYIFVMGGVVSSLGKGIAASSVGLILGKMGYKVGMVKLDPYFNVDPGTMSPFQHGEVFVTDDGSETDLDLGHYERFIGRPMDGNSNTTSGQIYESVINKERKGEYLGKTVQVIPHITNEINSFIKKKDKEYDFIITEIGGTVGDIESLPYLEAIRQLQMRLGQENGMFILLTYVPYIQAAGELKTKPTQHSAIKLREIGIQPDILVCRSETPFENDIRDKIALFTNVSKNRVINAFDAKYIYEVPLNFQNDGLGKILKEHFKLPKKKVDLSKWKSFVDNLNNPKSEVEIAVCGKYVEHQDAYKSIEESFIHASGNTNIKVNINWVDAERVMDDKTMHKTFETVDGILVPGGFGIRGIDGKIKIAKYARENNIPYFGICLGMQISVIEFAQNVCGIEDAYSSEFDKSCKNAVIDLMTEQNYIEQMGGSMRLGAFDCKLEKKSLAYKIYKSKVISERHRHRYEFNNEYREKLSSKGLIITGTSPDGLLVEIVEIPEHPFYIATQFHPEFKSNPNTPQPIFVEFIKAARKHSKKD